MSNHGTALSDDTIIRVDRSTPVVYPHYWWLKNVAHPEFQAKGPPEYDLATVELWLHKGQESARRVAGNLIKGQKKGRGVTGSLIYEHLLKNNMLVSCLGFADGLEIQKKGILVFRKFFNGKGLYLWNSVAEDLRDGLQVSFLAELGDEVVAGSATSGTATTLRLASQVELCGWGYFFVTNIALHHFNPSNRLRMCLSPLALHVLEWERELELSIPPLSHNVHPS
jgi:hypothetical protein